MKKVALITGASRGIGRAVAIAFAKEGYETILHYHTQKALAQKTAGELIESGLAASVAQADVANRREVEAMISAVLYRFGKIDVLVNNAGLADFGLFGDVTEERWRRLMGVNLDGVFHCCQCALPGMIARKEGVILNISSVWGLCGASCEVAYSASKAAVIGLTKALAKEVGPSNIRVNCIAPGVIDTDMNGSLDQAAMEELIQSTPLGRIGSPEEVAQAALFLAGEGASFITGQVLSPNGGFLI